MFQFSFRVHLAKGMAKESSPLSAFSNNKWKSEATVIQYGNVKQAGFYIFNVSFGSHNQDPNH